MTYKTETHLHTKESSACSYVGAQDIVEIYKRRGYQTIIVTPHYNYGYLKRITEDWNERIDYLLTGYKKAKKLGDILGVNVLLGLELALLQTKSDYLIYGMTEEFLRENPNLYYLSIDELIALCKENNFLLVGAHPFREGMELIDPKYNIPIEVFNGRHTLDAKNEVAKEYAKEHNLIGISGTDFHEVEDLEGGIITYKEIKSIEDFRDVVLNREFEIIESNRKQFK